MLYSVPTALIVGRVGSELANERVPDHRRRTSRTQAEDPVARRQHAA